MTNKDLTSEWALYADSGEDDLVESTTGGTFGIELRTSGIHIPQACALCGELVIPRTLNGYYDGRAVCAVCLPDELLAVQAIAYDRAYDAHDEVLARNPDDVLAALTAAIHTLQLVGVDIHGASPSSPIVIERWGRP